MTIPDDVALQAFVEGSTAVDARELLMRWTGCSDREVSQKSAALLEAGLLQPSSAGLILSHQGRMVYRHLQQWPGKTEDTSQNPAN